jgi:uncharacterized membrane protein YfcA
MIFFILIGLIVGILEGSLGAGAGAVLIPLLIWNGLSYSEAVALGLAMNSVPRGVPGVYIYYKQGDWRIRESIVVILSSTVGVFLGAYLMSIYKIPHRTMTRILSVVLMLLSIGLWTTNME